MESSVVNINPPLSLAYIAAILRKNHINVSMIDGNCQRYSFGEVINQLRTLDPQIIGISVFTFMYSRCGKLAKLIKEEFPAAKIVFGGPHINALHREVMKEIPYVDYCVYGEGEFTMLELVNALNSGKDLKSIKGLCFRENGEIIVTPERPFIENLDLLPFPARDLLPYDSYTAPQSLGGGRNSTILLSSRGCPFKCQYCDNHRSWKTQRRRSAENVLTEIEELYHDYGIRKIRIEDDLFTLNKKWVTDICNGLIEKKLNRLIWETTSRIGTLNPEVLQLMKKANCRSICLGIEFGSQRILDFAQKGIKIEAAYETVRMIKNAGIRAKSYFMLGYPTETKEEMEKTIKLSQDLGLDYANFSIVTPFYGTPLYDYLKENNMLKSTNWDDYHFASPKTIYRKDIKDEELLALCARAHKEFWYRPIQIFKSLIWHPSFNLKYSFYLISKFINNLIHAR